MKLYTLKKTMSGRHQCLNGKIFYIKKDNAGCAHFYEAGGTEIWVTTTVNDITHTKDGLAMLTNNTIYEFVDVSTLIPTTTPSECAEPILIESKPIGFKAIHYGDGYHETEYRFDRALSENDMRGWLQTHDKVYKSEKQVPWYEDYAELTPNKEDDNVWIVRTVHRYTD